MTADSLEGRLVRVRMVLAEAGWDPGLACVMNGRLWIRTFGVPDAVQWRAWEMGGVAIACWSCWSEQIALGGCRQLRTPCDCLVHRCMAGDCSHPDLPRRPPKHLLTRPNIEVTV